jgi:hypothetical protein
MSQDRERLIAGAVASIAINAQDFFPRMWTSTPFDPIIRNAPIRWMQNRDDPESIPNISPQGSAANQVTLGHFRGTIISGNPNWANTP